MDAGGFTQGYNDTGGGLNGIGNGIIEGRFAAPYLGWEVEDKQNYGFDIGLFDNRLEVIFDYFDSTKPDSAATSDCSPAWRSERRSVAKLR